MAGGFFQWLPWPLRLAEATADLTSTQKTLGGEPVVTLTIGSHTLGAFVVGYHYRERAQTPGSLTIWLDNRADRFDDLAADYPDLKRGAAVDLRRGLPVGGVDTTAKLPQTWVDGLRYMTVEGGGLLRLDCIDWWEKLQRFRYSSAQRWVATEIATIASSVLGEVGLTLMAGAFGVSVNFDVSVRRDGDEAVKDVVSRVEEYLYAGLDGEIKHKELDPAEAAGYDYDWSTGGGANHPLLSETEIAESSPRFNKVVVVGGTGGEWIGSAEDATESGLVGVRLRTITDRGVDSDAKCAERAQAELRYWQAQVVSGLVRARPHFSLRLYDVVSVAAPAYGGPAITAGRVTEIVEEYGRLRGLWEQRLTLGRLPMRYVSSWVLSDGAVTAEHVDESARLTARGFIVRDEEDVIQFSRAVLDAGVGASATFEVSGKDGTSPEGLLELVVVTHDGAVHSGVATVTMTLDTETGKIDLGGALRMVFGTTYQEMTEQAADPAAPGANRGRLYLRDDGEGNTQICVRFNTGDIVVLAEQGQLVAGEGSVSSCRFWEYDGVDGTPRTVIADGTGDVTEILTVIYSVVDSDGETSGGMTTVEPGDSKNIYDKLATLSLAVAADGSVTVQRTAGSVTFKVALWLVWI